MRSIKDKEKKFIDANVKLIKALLEGDDLSVKEMRQVIMETMNRLTTLPTDHVMTRAMVRRAKYEARNTPHKYKCPTCHKVFDSRDELLKDLEDHMIDFYAGIPTRLSPVHVQRLKSMIPKHVHHKLKYRVEKGAHIPEEEEK